MVVLKRSFRLISVLCIALFTTLVHAEALKHDYLLLQQEIKQAAQQNISNPVEHVFDTYKKSTGIITLTIDDEAMSDEGNGQRAQIKQKDLTKPEALADELWQAFLLLNKEPIYSAYSGGDVDVSFFELGQEKTQGVVFVFNNMGSAAGTFHLFYVFDKSSKNYIPLTKSEDDFFMGQKGDDNDIFFISFHGRQYVVYREGNAFSLCDTKTLVAISKNEAVDGFTATYRYEYKIAKALDKKEAQDEIGGIVDDAVRDTNTMVPIINNTLAKGYASIANDCPLGEDEQSNSSYVDQWYFTFKYQNVCYYNLMTCSLNDAYSSCDLELYSGKQQGKKVFQVDKKRYLEKIEP